VSRKPLSRREQMLLLLVSALLVGMSYGLFRYLPAEREIEQFVREHEETQAKIKEIQLPKEPAEDLDSLQKQQTEMEQALADARAQLASLEAAFVPVDRPEMLHRLQVEISELAEASGVRIVESAPHAAKALPAGQKSGRETASLSPSIGASPDPRPLRRFEIATSYSGFQRFLRGLNRLPWRVTVVEFTLEALRTPQSGSGEAPLSATLILAL
jgi:Tfp pilus assembly protein PilO